MTATFATVLSGGGRTIQTSVTRSGTTLPYSETLPAGKAGTLSTRTDDNTGTITATAHGLAVNDVVDVYWSGAGNVRYGMLVTAVADANTVTVDGGSGDVLPAQSTAVVVSEQVVIDVGIDGAQIQVIGVLADSTASSSSSNAHADFLDANGTQIAQLDLVAKVARVWDVSGGQTNDFNPSVTGVFTAEADDEIITDTAHGLLEGQQVKVSNSGGALPTGLTAGVWYFVKYLSANTFSLATTLGGAAINITTDGTGTQTWTRRNAITQIKASNGSSSESLTFTCLVTIDATQA